MLNKINDDFLPKNWFSEVRQYTKLQYQAIETRLQRCFQYVTPHRDNAEVFSYEFASILRDSGSAFDSILRKIIETSGTKENPNIKDFFSFLKIYEPNVEKISISFQTPGQFIHPFKHDEDKSPEWWDAYNKVKHSEIDNVKYGNFKNAVNALGAVATLYWCFYGDSGLQSFQMHRISINSDDEYFPTFFEYSIPRLSFKVEGLPPHQKAKNSIWSDQTQAPLLIKLRKQALNAKNNWGILKEFSNLRLDLEIYARKPMLDSLGDIDNYLGGVCDGLKPRPNNPTLHPHPGFNETENSDVSPEKAIFYNDDNVITSINGNKNETNNDPFYIVKIYEL